MILSSRISNQLLSQCAESPLDVVHHMTCIQWQNYNQHLRAIAVRCGCKKQDIEKLYTDWHIVRTRTQRGTIHSVCTEDVWWIVGLCASRTLRYFERRRESLWLSWTLMNKMVDELQKYCSNRQIRTRKEIITHLSQCFSIEIPKNWWYIITCYAASLWLIAMWPRTENSEQWYILLSERTNSVKHRSEAESLYELTKRYFGSHWYASIDDFSWWSGLTKTQIKKGIELCHDIVLQNVIDWKTYYTLKQNSSDECEWSIAIKQKNIHILPSFDEFLLWYKYRWATVEEKYLRNIDPARNGIFKPTIMIDGQQIATWKVKKRTHERDITVLPFDTIEKKYHSQVISSFKKYSEFIEKKLQIHFA